MLLLNTYVYHIIHYLLPKIKSRWLFFSNSFRFSKQLKFFFTIFLSILVLVIQDEFSSFKQKKEVGFGMKDDSLLLPILTLCEKGEKRESIGSWQTN